MISSTGKSPVCPHPQCTIDRCNVFRYFREDRVWKLVLSPNGDGTQSYRLWLASVR